MAKPPLRDTTYNPFAHLSSASLDQQISFTHLCRHASSLDPNKSVLIEQSQLMVHLQAFSRAVNWVTLSKEIPFQLLKVCSERLCFWEENSSHVDRFMSMTGKRCVRIAVLKAVVLVVMTADPSLSCKLFPKVTFFKDSKLPCPPFV